EAQHLGLECEARQANLPATPCLLKSTRLQRFFSGEEATMAEITLAKALKVKNRLTGRLAKVQADIQAYNSVPAGQAHQGNCPALMETREELVGALVELKTAINDAGGQPAFL